MRLVAIGLVAIFLLAGCAGNSPKKASPSDDAFGSLAPKATATTGIIRGVVVDDAIRPLAGAALNVTSAGQPARSGSTNAQGAFAFDGLAPGTYFIRVEKAGFLFAQQSAEVVAGVDQPPIVKIQLQRDAGFIAPYYEEYVLSGYIECGVTTAVVAYAACSQPNGCNPGVGGVCATNQNFTNDNFNQFIAVSRPPTWVQHEVIWEATQSTGNMFNLAMRNGTQAEFDTGSYDSDIGNRDLIGVSPLLGVLNSTVLADAKIGIGGVGLVPAVFSGGMEGTQACDPTHTVGCLFANGATVEQKFTMYTHVFYGYTPPEGWRFSSGDPVPLPPQ